MIPLHDNIKSKTFPFVTWSLLLANFYVFYLELRLGHSKPLEHFINHWAVVPKELWSDLPHHAYTLVTATFLHGGWMHIASNMLFLYIFGDNVEDSYGHFRYLLFYLLVGVVANGTQAYFSAASFVPLLGASGAIAGILGSYFFFYPYAKVATLIPIFFFITIREIPAFVFLLYWFLLQTMNSAFSITSNAVAGHAAGGVAFIAHAAGFVAGILMSPIFGKPTSRFR